MTSTARPGSRSYVLERLAKLEKFAQGITSCRVSLTQEQASHHKGNRYSVLVEVRLPPNHDLAAKKAKMIHDMATQLPALINLAFGAIEPAEEDRRAASRRSGRPTCATTVTRTALSRSSSTRVTASCAPWTTTGRSTSIGTASCTATSSGWRCTGAFHRAGRRAGPAGVQRPDRRPLKPPVAFWGEWVNIRP